jgi:hypothetical protein
MSSRNLLRFLLERGDEVSVVKGLLQIEPRSGSEVPSDWLSSHQAELGKEIGNVLSLPVFEYQGHKTGIYDCKASGNIRDSGLSLSLLDLAAQRNAFCIFNVDLTRERQTRFGDKGSPLPKGHFRPKAGSAFMKFWKLCPFKPRKDNSSFHRRMGNLSPLLLTGQYRQGEKVTASTLKPLDVRHEQISQAIFETYSVRNTCVTGVYEVRKPCVSNVRKESGKPLTQRDLQADSTTGADHYGNKVIRKGDIKNSSLQLIDNKPPEEQTVDEWLQDYTKSA